MWTGTTSSLSGCATETAKLSASQLGALSPNPSYEQLKGTVENAYEHKSYAYRGQRLDDLDRSIRRMHLRDLVLTPADAG